MINLVWTKRRINGGIIKQLQELFCVLVTIQLMFVRSDKSLTKCAIMTEMNDSLAEGLLVLGLRDIILLNIDCGRFSFFFFTKPAEHLSFKCSRQFLWTFISQTAFK